MKEVSRPLRQRTAWWRRATFFIRVATWESVLAPADVKVGRVDLKSHPVDGRIASPDPGSNLPLGDNAGATPFTSVADTLSQITTEFFHCSDGSDISEHRNEANLVAARKGDGFLEEGEIDNSAVWKRCRKRSRRYSGRIRGTGRR